MGREVERDWREGAWWAEMVGKDVLVEEEEGEEVAEVSAAAATAS